MDALKMAALWLLLAVLFILALIAILLFMDAIGKKKPILLPLVTLLSSLGGMLLVHLLT